MELLMLPKEDLELIDALVLVGAISRGGARELVSCDVQPGRVATRIMELGLCNLAGGGYVIVDRLAKYEASEERDRSDRLDRDLCSQPWETD
jgi:hypothetical protein